MKTMVSAMALVALVALGTAAKAALIAPQPLAVRMAVADGVIIGKVTEVPEKTEAADMFKGDTRQMKVTTVKVEDTLVGKKAKTIKVAFFPPMGGVIRPGGYRGVQLAKDQEGLFLLTKHPSKKDIYVVQGPYDFVNKAGNTNFKNDTAEAKKYARLLADPKKGLASKDAKERFETAAILITRYRTPSGGNTKTEAVPQADSKKILLALAGADWNAAAGPRGFLTLNPSMIFYRLNLTDKDGWEPKDPAKFQEEAKKWLKDNAGKYRIQRYVRADDKKGIDPEPE